jgi:hypothetical protein
MTDSPMQNMRTLARAQPICFASRSHLRTHGHTVLLILDYGCTCCCQAQNLKPLHLNPCMANSPMQDMRTLARLQPICFASHYHLCTQDHAMLQQPLIMRQHPLGPRA